MAGCIFQGVLPTISPLDFDVEMPCYDSCWEATTAADCLQQLQKWPRQILVSTAIRRIRASTQNGPLFEASGFGMFVIVNGKYTQLKNRTRSSLISHRNTLSPLSSNQIRYRQSLRQGRCPLCWTFFCAKPRSIRP